MNMWKLYNFLSKFKLISIFILLYILCVLHILKICRIKLSTTFLTNRIKTIYSKKNRKRMFKIIAISYSNNLYQKQLKLNKNQKIIYNVK